MTTQNEIICGLSTAFINKNLRAGESKAAYSASFKPSRVTVQTLASHINMGGAWCVAQVSDRRRIKDNFVSSQIIALDCDDNVSVQDALAHDDVKRYAAIVHPSPSHTDELARSRIIFVLDKAIEDASLYEATVIATQHHFRSLRPDSAAKDCVRFFYGSTVSGGQIMPDKILTLDTLETWRKAYAAHLDAQLEATRQDAPAKTIIPGQGRAERYAAGAYSNIFDNLRTTASGRNNALYNAALNLYSRLTWPGFNAMTIERDLLGAARANGYIAKDGESAALATIHSAQRVANQIPLEIPDKTDHAPAKSDGPRSEPPPCHIKEVALAPFRADERHNVRWCSDIPLDDASILLKSAMATGKTHAVAMRIRQVIERVQATTGRPGRALVITQLQSLSENLADRLQAITGLPFEHYRSIVDAGYSSSLGGINYLVCSLDQLHKIDNAGKYDVLFWDEPVGGISHIIYAETLGDKNIKTWANLTKIVQRAGQFIAADAQASDLHHSILSAMRPGLTAIENTYKHTWGSIEIVNTPGVLVNDAFACADAHPDECTVIACSSRKRARIIEREAIARYGKDAVGTIHAKKGAIANHLRRELDGTIDAYRVLIVTSSVGTGYDVKARVAGVYQIVDRPLTADAGIQMGFRYRNADRRVAYVYPHESNYETDSDVLLDRNFSAAAKTAQRADFASENIPLMSHMHAKLALIKADLDAAANRQKNALKAYFIALAKQQGCEIVYRTDSAAYDLKAAKDALEAADIERVQVVQPRDKRTLDNLIKAGEHTEDDFFGYMRWQIENLTGENITPEMALDYYRKSERKGLLRYTDLTHASRSELMQRDRVESGRNLYHRQHHTLGYDLAQDAIKAVFGDAGLTSDERIPAFELRRRLAGFFTTENIEILYALDGRKDLSNDPIAAWKRLLNRYHIVIVSERGRVLNPATGENIPVQVYSLDQNRLAVIRARAEKCRAMMLEESVGNTYITPNYVNPTNTARYSLTPLDTGALSPQPPQTTGRRRDFDCASVQF